MIGEKANPKSERFLDSPRNDKGPMMTWMRGSGSPRRAAAKRRLVTWSKDRVISSLFRKMIFERHTHKSCSFTWEASRQVVSSRGIAPRETDKRQLDWQR